jgi:mono/diheme cytochrome c family protein
MRNRPSSDPSRRLFAALLIAALCPFVASIVVVPESAHGTAIEATLAAQGQTTIWDGVYTDDQATRGQHVYEQECAQCHLDDLMGDGIAPALIGSSFFFRWSDLSVGDMYVAIRTTMPQGAPASLSPAGYVDISAYLLQMNKVPSGDTELPTDPDDLGDITITEEAQ